MNRSEEIIGLAWDLYTEKVSGGLLDPRNEKMMQLQMAQILQELSPLFETNPNEAYKVILEHPVRIKNGMAIIDIVVDYSVEGRSHLSAIELKCYRLLSGSGSGKRGAQNLGMYDYWADIENLETYLGNGFQSAHHLTLTDDPYYVEGAHSKGQVQVYSTNRKRRDVSGMLQFPMPHREGRVSLKRIYGLPWITKSGFHFIVQSISE